jgi:P27 family predicted phage terminase small subunit
MGTTGRKPTPASLIDHQVFKKSAKVIEARKEVESKLTSTALLKCPSYISSEAKKEWKRIMKLYRKMEADILSDLDIMALVMYCEATAIYKEAQSVWAKYGKVVASNPEAQRVLDKTFITMEKQTKIVSSLSEQLCLTPVGRARMGMNAVNQKEPNKLEQLLADDD